MYRYAMDICEPRGWIARGHFHTLANAKREAQWIRDGLGLATRVRNLELNAPAPGLDVIVEYRLA